MRTLFNQLQALIIPLGIISLTACNQPSSKAAATMTDSTTQSTLPADSSFTRTIDGKKTQLYTMKSKGGLEVAVTNYGAHLVSVVAPDKSGKLVSVCLGMDNLEGYQKTKGNYYGGTIGLYGNRIA